MKGVKTEFFTLCMAFRKVIFFIYQKIYLSDRVPLKWSLTLKTKSCLDTCQLTHWATILHLILFVLGYWKIYTANSQCISQNQKFTLYQGDCPEHVMALDESLPSAEDKDKEETFQDTEFGSLRNHVTRKVSKLKRKLLLWKHYYITIFFVFTWNWTT